MADKMKHMNRTKDNLMSRKVNSDETQPSKNEWIHYHAKKIYAFWLQWQSPFGIACNYMEQIKNDLKEFYDDPLKRTFIETTYC